MKKYSGEVSIFADEMSGSIMEIEFEDKKLQKSSKKVQVIRKSARCVDRANIVKLNPNSMEYDVFLAGLEIPCIGAATVNEEGKITEYIVRPR